MNLRSAEQCVIDLLYRSPIDWRLVQTRPKPERLYVAIANIYEHVDKDTAKWLRNLPPLVYIHIAEACGLVPCQLFFL